jgi:hypothetical protein
MRFVFSFIAILLFSFSASAQLRSSLRMKYIPLQSDTVKLDTLSVAPNGFSLKTAKGTVLDTSYYEMDYLRARLIWKQKRSAFSPSDSILATYRVFPMLFSEPVRHKDQAMIGMDASGLVNAYLYTPAPKSSFDLLKAEGLSKSGGIARGITFGNNQDVFVNSSFNLQMAGKLGDDVNVLAAITDENLPLQPAGNTQQLQDFDKVFIQLTKDSSRLIAGDYDLYRPDSYFMNFNKKNQGGYFTTRFKLNSRSSDPALMRVGISGAVSKGKFARNTIVAVEGNQGPYLLKGNNNETFIIVLAGSEKVFIDGHLLVRGAEQDYVIDYNTSEILFTPRRLITKDSRIIVEFEYSDKNYGRSLLYFNDEVETKKMKLKFNVYSEQDSKSQPLLLELDSAQKQVMADIGDNIDSAYFNTADSVAFSADRVLYLKKDTTTLNGTYSGVYVYSISPDSAHWLVTFSNVGANRGDYIPENTAANGRVFKWVEPVAGIHQGSYAPVTLLITPKKQQMVTLGADVALSSQLKAGAEVAMSNYDINLYSTKDKGNDQGYATKVYVQQTLRLQHDSVGWTLHNKANYEYANVNFKPVERYRPVEFERDWNLSTQTSIHDNHFITLESFLENPKKGFLGYQLRSYLNGTDYTGLMNSLNGNYHASHWNVTINGSFLNTTGLTTKTKYLKHLVDLSRTVGPVVLGVREAQENNRYEKPGSDTLLLNSFYFQEFSAYANTVESAKFHALLNYKYRVDNAPAGNDFLKSAVAQDVNLNLEFLSDPNQQLKTTTTYRNLSIEDSTRTTQRPENTLLNRIDYNGIFFSGGLSTTIYYVISRGQELKKEYAYLEVAPGQGSYVWKDYNENGIRELNEFEIASAALAAEANFVKIFVPTTEYISTKGNQFSTVINLTPATFLKPRDGKPRTGSQFSDQFSVTLNKNTTDDDLAASLNPFDQSIDDSSLISTNSAFRNTLFFNRTHPVYGIDGTWQRTQNKTLLVNGFEGRTQTSVSVNLRWNFTQAFMFTTRGESGDKESRSEFFSDRDYLIHFRSLEPKMTYQPDAALRLSASYEYSRKENAIPESNELSEGNTVNLEARYSKVKSGIFTAKFSFINLSYNGEKNSALAYEMLEGLNPGKNITWNFAVQRSLGNFMQLSLNYEGRKSEGSDIVHVGGMQFRAFF